ncbi:hypothetical protein [Streptomyces asoensis]|uniref:hypothetical protein n=1 Tax=Streptomyces asoensis TaxID=249586 RepID=UPI0035563F73
MPHQQVHTPGGLPRRYPALVEQGRQGLDRAQLVRAAGPGDERGAGGNGVREERPGVGSERRLRPLAPASPPAPAGAAAPSGSSSTAACSSAVSRTYTYNEAAPVSSSAARRRIVSPRGPSARSTAGAAVTMPSLVGAGLAGRSRRLRGVSGCAVMAPQ